MKRFFGAACSVVVLSCLAIGAADLFQTYGLSRQGWSERFVDAVFHTDFTPYQAKQLKAVPVAERAAVVNALGALAKTFFDTPEFKAAYKKSYEASLPEPAKPPRSKAEIEADLMAKYEKSIKDAQETAKTVSGDMKKAVEQAVAMLREQEKTVPQMAEMMAQSEKQQYEMTKNRPPDPKAPPADPKVALRRSLKKFLDVTAGVDYAAQTKASFANKVFVNASYEQKSAEWKMCYRAGHDACEAARTFATGWLAELK